jgi:FkbM family methyltransferase
LFGTKLSAQDEHKWLADVLQASGGRVTADSMFFEFSGGGIKLPSPKGEWHQAIFVEEMIDIVFPYLLEDGDFYDAVAVEGPYEFGGATIAHGDIVIDAGANMGLFSAIASMKGATVYAFEPSKNVIDKYLTITASYNQNIHVCPYALSDSMEELTFFDCESIISGGFIEKAIAFGNTKSRNPLAVQAIPLDTFVHENNLPHVDFIKADIEGAERYMLMGAKQVLHDFAPKLAICTYHLPDDPKVLREIILDANPNYVIEEKWKKMYAYVPK